MKKQKTEMEGIWENMPIFSIIVPVYNVESYLKLCIDSILRQTFSDFEVILVDDGSPDNCGNICDAYTIRDSRVRVIHKKNGGLSSARNAGLDIACGDYICFVDSDDLIPENMLETLLPYVQAGMDMVAYRMTRFYPDGSRESREIQYGSYRMENEAERAAFIHQVLLPGRISWDAGSRIYARKKIEEYHLRFADNQKIFAEDLFFCICFCSHAQKVESIDYSLYDYRMRDDSIMGIQRKRHNIDRLTVLCQEVYRYLDQFDDCRILIQNIHTICCQIIAPHLINYLWTAEQTLLESRTQVIRDVTQWGFLEGCIRSQMKERTALFGFYSGSEAAELMANLHFLLHGSDLRLRVQIRLIHMFRPLLDYLGKRWTK